MEQKNPKIEFEIKHLPTYLVPANEMRAMYVRMALMQRRYLRVPDYNEHLVLKQLIIDLRKMFTEAQILSEKFPNNHQLQCIRTFFDKHYKHLLDLTSEQ